MAGVCVEPFPTHSYDGGLFQARRCLLVDRALTGSLDGRTVEMEGDGTQPDGLFCWLIFYFALLCFTASDPVVVTQDNSVACHVNKVC